MNCCLSIIFNSRIIVRSPFFLLDKTEMLFNKYIMSDVGKINYSPLLMLLKLSMKSLILKIWLSFNFIERLLAGSPFLY